MAMIKTQRRVLKNAEKELAYVIHQFEYNITVSLKKLNLISANSDM